MTTLAIALAAGGIILILWAVHGDPNTTPLDVVKNVVTTGKR